MSQSSATPTTATQTQSVREIALSVPADHRAVVYRNGRAIVIFSRRLPLRRAMAAAINAAINSR